MTNTKSTKRALLTSVMALFLCFTMLLGTTYAWFTDSVTSANNVIKSGNLDITLEYWNGNEWKDVEGSSDILKGDLWEPGYTDVAYLRIKNAGSLALKYQLGVNIIPEEKPGTNVYGETFKLSDYIYFEVIDEMNAEKGTYKTSADVLNAVEKNPSESLKISEGYFKAGTLLANSEPVYLAMAVYMPTGVGNDANHDGVDIPRIDLGINILATQMAYENDGTGDIYYDAGAPWLGGVDTAWYEAEPDAKEFTLYTSEELAGLAQLVNSGTDTFSGKTIKLGTDLDLGDIRWTPIGSSSGGWDTKFNGTFIGTGYTISNLRVVGKSGLGLFGYVGSTAHIEGVTIDGAYVSGNDYVGAVVGTGYLAANCLLNCTVMNAEIIATPYLKADGKTYDGGAKAGAVAGFLSNGNISGNKAINCSVTAYRDLGGIVGMASAENHNIEVFGNEVENVKLTYVGAAPYDSKTTNQNMGTIIGRTGGDYTVAVQEDNEKITDAVPEYACVTTKEGVITALKAGATTIDAQGADIGNLNYALGTSSLVINEGTEVTIKNAVVSSRSYGNMVNGTVTFENCQFTAGLYSIHFSDDNGTATGTGVVIFKNCDLVGWNSFGTGLKVVEMYDCTLVDNGTYGIIRSYVDLYMENCSIDVTGANPTDVYYDGVEVVEGATLTMVNCTEVVTTAGALANAMANGANVTLTGTIDMGGATVAIANGTTISGGTIENAHLTAADDNSVSFNGVTFDNTTTVEAKGDGRLSFVDCEFNVTPAMYNGFSRGAAIIGANQYYTLDLYLEGCTFNYQYEEGDADRYNCAIFMWSNVDSCVIKNCTFNDYGFMAIKLMNVVEGAEIVFEGNTFNMCESTASNYYNNNAVQIMPQHDNALTVKFVDNTFTGDYRDGTMVAKIEVMHGGALSNLTFEQSGNTLNGEAITEANFAIKAN